MHNPDKPEAQAKEFPFACASGLSESVVLAALSWISRPSETAHVHDFAAVAGGKGWHNRISRVGKKTNRTVREKPIAAAGVEAPEVIPIARIVQSPRSEES